MDLGADAAEVTQIGVTARPSGKTAWIWVCLVAACRRGRDPRPRNYWPDSSSPAAMSSDAAVCRTSWIVASFTPARRVASLLSTQLKLTRGSAEDGARRRT